MIIVWGKKRKLKSLGYAADFCPICREARPFRIERVSIASHIYYVSLGAGETVGYLRTCETCGAVLDAEPTRYREVAPEPGRQISDLIAKTYPGFRETYAERLRLEETIRSSPHQLPAAEREALIREPFVVMAPLAEARLSGDTQFDRESGLGCLLTLAVPAIVLLMAGFLLAHFFDREGSKKIWPVVGIVALVLFGAGLVYTIVQLALAPGRWIRRQLLPKIVSALAPLKPSEQELTDCLALLGTTDLRIAKKIKVSHLLELIRQKDRAWSDTNRSAKR
jgi:hypothetical protein